MCVYVLLPDTVSALSPHSLRGFSWSSHISALEIGIPVATLPDAWRYRVNAVTGEPVPVYHGGVR